MLYRDPVSDISYTPSVIVVVVVIIIVLAFEGLSRANLIAAPDMSPADGGDGGDSGIGAYYGRWAAAYRTAVRIARVRPTTATTVRLTSAPDDGARGKAAVAKSSCVLIDEYTRHSTVHGMRYIPRASLLEK